MTEQNWYDDKPSQDISIPEFDAIIKEVFAQREKIEQIQKTLKDESAILERMNLKVMAYLKQLNRDSYKTPLGSIGIQRRTSVTMPKDIESREKFFEYLKSTKQYDQLITINSQTLNAWYKAELEQAENAGNSLGFQVPGLGQPSIFETIRVTKGR